MERRAKTKFSRDVLENFVFVRLVSTNRTTPLKPFTHKMEKNARKYLLSFKKILKEYFLSYNI